MVDLACRRIMAVSDRIEIGITLVSISGQLQAQKKYSYTAIVTAVVSTR